MKTIAGQQDFAIQLLDQSPIAFDQVIFSDLVADHSVQVDLQVLAGSNSAGQVKGILSASGTNSIYTDTTPTVPELYPRVADAIQQIHTGRYLEPTVIVMHPRRWAWMLAGVDDGHRPLIVPNAAQNLIAIQNGVASQRVVGSLQGLPVVTDPNIGITSGSGTNEDKVM